MITFEWDPAKAASNKRKHGVSFDEAQSVFFDEFAVQFFDEENSQTESRFLMLGFSDEARLLLVCHCERDHQYIVCTWRGLSRSPCSSANRRFAALSRSFRVERRVGDTLC